MIPHKEDRLLNVGVLGCGPIAQFAHLQACQKARNAGLYAICDVAEDLVNRLAVYYAPEKVYNDYKTMLSDPKLEAVIIATADAFHVEAARMALEAGKHVLVEKPLGIDIEACESLLNCLEGTGLCIQVAHMKRFDPGIAFARQFIEQEMGDLVALKAWYCDSSERYAATDSLHPVHLVSKKSRKPTENPKADLERYYMLAHGSHLLDTAFFLAGSIRSVKANLVQKEDIYSWFIDTEFANGCNGHLDLTVAIRADWHEGFHIYGTRGSVFAKTYNPRYYKASEVHCYSAQNKKYIKPLNNDANFYKLQLEGFADHILYGKPQTGTSLKEGIQVVRAMVAIAKSVRENRQVSLAEVKGKV